MNSETASEFLQFAWDAIESGARSRKAPWRNPILGTTGENGSQVRTITLRSAFRQQRIIQFNSDVRALKVTEIQKHPEISMIQYSLALKAQIRIKATATVHHLDKVASAAWATTVPFARRCYMAHSGSSTPVSAPDFGFPAEFADIEPTLEQSEQGFANFSTICAEVHQIDVVRLFHGGHLRCELNWIVNNWNHQWLIP